MDILQLVDRSIEALPEGTHVLGLRAVMGHISVAARYLERAREIDEFDLYTDVIYRTNQAFEGSIKEAYRVLSGKDPRKKTTNDIEEYLKSEGVLRDRVLTQFTRYRQEWRNPSTHDYTLDFDESEAYLALISVAGFSKVLIDQIASALAAKRSWDVDATRNMEADPEGVPLLDVIASEISRLMNLLADEDVLPRTESELLGYIFGYLSSHDPRLVIKMEPEIDKSGHRLDMLMSVNGEEVFLEVKRSRLPRTLVSSDFSQVQSYVESKEDAKGVLLMWHPQALKYEATGWPPDFPEGNRLRVVLFEKIENDD